MGITYNVYCDESCHLQNDHQQAMVLGAVWCALEKTREVATRLREIKSRHGFHPAFEIKWTKVSPAKFLFYKDIIDYFFDNDDLHFRALVIPDKTKLRHNDFSQDHDTWYYKMYFDLLKALLSPSCQYRIYLDIKDTKSINKVKSLHEILCNSMYDFRHEIITRIQTTRSHEVEQLQLADLLIGAISYVNRNLHENKAKLDLIERVRVRSQYSLTKTTLLREEKFNLFKWEAR
ncbi:MAG TPA: DUF3800 domain-containing protein [Ktedonobacteraceae bacterium]|jgi:hypothetical protein